MNLKFGKLVCWLMTVVSLTVAFSGCLEIQEEEEEAYWQTGDRCYVPDMRQHGTVELHCNDWGYWWWSVLFDNEDCYIGGDFSRPDYLSPFSPSLELSRQLNGTGRVLKVNNSKYLEIADSPRFPSPVLWRYANSVCVHHAHPPTEDIRCYCIDKHGNYHGGITCYNESNDEIVHYTVTGLDLTVWKLQNLLDNKTNLNKPMPKVRKSTQSYQNYTEIDYTLLKSWMDCYSLTYNNQSLVLADFGEIKNNTPFMSEYCSTYGYSGYDVNGSCYRVV